MLSLKHFAKDAITYSISGWISKAISFLLVPVYTRIFSTDEYGILDLTATTIAFTGIVAQCGLDSALTRFYSSSKVASEKKRYFSTVFWTKVSIYVPLLGVCILISSPLSEWIFGDRRYAELLSWALVSILTTSLWSLFLQLYRLEFMAVAYSILCIAYLICGLSLTVYFVVFAKTGIIGIYWAKVIVDTGFVAYLVLSNLRYLLNPEWRYLRRLLYFGLPLVPSAIAYYFMQYSDRYFIRAFGELSDLGVYAIAYKLASVLMLIASGFSVAWPPFLFGVYDQRNGPELIGRIFRIYALGLGIISFGVGLFAKEVLILCTSRAYVQAFYVTYILAIAWTVYLTTDYFCVGIDIENQTQHRMWAGFLGALCNLSLNWILIPSFGICGAAWATLVSYVAYGAYVMRISQRLYPVDYGMGRYFSILGIFTSVTYASFFIKGSFLFSVFSKTAIFLVVGIVTPVATGFLRLNEVTKMVKEVRRCIFHCEA